MLLLEKIRLGIAQFVYHLIVGLLFVCVFTVSNAQEDTSDIERLIEWVDANSESNLPKVIDTLEQTLDQLRNSSSKDLDSEVKILDKLAIVMLVRMNNFERAMNYNEQILAIAEANQRIDFKIKYHDRLGVIYYYDRIDIEKAFNQFEIAIELTNSHNEKRYADQVLGNYGLALMSSGNPDSAVKVFHQALHMIEGNSKRYSLKSTILSNLGVCNIYLGNRDSAIYYFQRAIDFAELSNGVSDDASRLMFMGVFLQEIGRHNDALDYLLKSYELIDHLLIHRDKALLCQVLGEVYLVIGNKDKAIEFVKLELKYRDSINIVGMAQQAFAYEYQKEMEELENKRIIEELEHRIKESSFKSRILTLFLILIITLLVAFIVFYRLNKLKQINEIKAHNEYIEKERIRQQAELDLLRKDEELIQANVELSVRSNELMSLKEKLQAHLNKSHDPDFDDLKYFLHEIKGSEKRGEQLKNLDKLLSYSTNSFYNSFKKAHPELTEDEMRLATLIRLNLGMEELMIVFNISKASLHTKRYRLRKKLALLKDDSLEERILSF